jgi:uncharacterized protein (TIGR00251 family)
MPGRESCVRQLGDDVVLSVRVQPRASRNEVLEVRDSRLLIRTTAAPADGKANKAVIRLLADFLDVAPSRISLMRGQTQRNKLVRVSGPVELPPAIFHDNAANGL